MERGGTIWFWSAKRVLDVLLCVILFGVLFLAALTLTLLNPWLNSGPLLFRQQRVGKHNQPFVMFKFRTMQKGDAVPRFADAETYRIGRFGAILRHYRIDELPQIINVLKGDMSLIGPRPEQPAFVCDYEVSLPGYLLRHEARPGVSGLAQVVLGYTSDIRGTQQKLAYDLRYTAGSGFRMECYVLWRTVVTILTGFGAR